MQKRIRAENGLSLMNNVGTTRIRKAPPPYPTRPPTTHPRAPRRAPAGRAGPWVGGRKALVVSCNSEIALLLLIRVLTAYYPFDWEQIDMSRAYLFEMLTSPIFIGLGIPFLVIAVIVAVRWIQHGGTRPRIEDFVLGYELSVTALALATTKAFEGLGRIAAANSMKIPKLLIFNEPLMNPPEPVEFALTIWVVLVFLSIVSILIVMALRQYYLDNRADNIAEGLPAISQGRFWAINLVGVFPLFLSLFNLL